MLLDLSFIAHNYQVVILSVMMLLVIKFMVGGLTGFFLGHTLQGTVMIGLSLSQVGEFSFLLAQRGFSNSILSEFNYHLFLAVAVVTMAFTPFFFYLGPPLSRLLLRLPLPRFMITGLFPLQEIEIPDFSNHMVIIGKDASALDLSRMAKANDIRHISIIFDPATAREKMNAGDLVVYGDAVNEPILRKAHADTADIVVISVGSVIPSMAIIDKVRHLNKNVFILARATLIRNVEQLYKAGADQVIPEKLEIAIDLLNRVLVRRLIPENEINGVITHIRNASLGEFSVRDTLRSQVLPDGLPGFNIAAIKVKKGASAEGLSLLETDLRKNTGVTVLAIKRGSQIIEHPVPDTRLQSDDVTYILGDQAQINSASELLAGKGN
jgi:monovalent cation:H+ antiporter-2, CPA2 family